MKKKIEKLMKKIVSPPRKSAGNNYYGVSGGENEVDWEDKCKELEKENEKLKVSFREQCIESFKTRRSIRKFNKDQKPDFKLIYDIIEAGLNAPIAGNLQNYKVIVIENDGQKNEIAKYAFQQYWIADAPYLLVIVRDNMKVESMYPDKGELFSVQNVAALIENIVMAIHMSDLASCWVAVDDNDAIKTILKVPSTHFIDAVIPIGYPMEVCSVQGRSNTMCLVDFEKYGKKEKRGTITEHNI